MIYATYNIQKVIPSVEYSANYISIYPSDTKKNTKKYNKNEIEPEILVKSRACEFKDTQTTRKNKST